jgi:hypothetical protein
MILENPLRFAALYCDLVKAVCGGRKLIDTAAKALGIRTKEQCVPFRGSSLLGKVLNSGIIRSNSMSLAIAVASQGRDLTLLNAKQTLVICVWICRHWGVYVELLAICAFPAGWANCSIEITLSSSQRISDNSVQNMENAAPTLNLASRSKCARRIPKIIDVNLVRAH